MAGPEPVRREAAAAGKRPAAATAAVNNSEVLHQRSKLPMCPAKLAIGGFVAAAALGYFVLYTKKKPEASAVDVAKVTAGIPRPENTHPSK